MFQISFALRFRHKKSSMSLAVPGKSAYRTSPNCPVSAFYKGESQGKKFPGDWKERRGSLCVPAHVMLRGSGGFLSLEIHFVSVTTLSASDANKQCSCEVPTMVLSETRGLAGC